VIEHKTTKGTQAVWVHKAPCTMSWCCIKQYKNISEHMGFLFLIKQRSCALILICTMMQEPEELFETVSQALLASVDRDCLSGWGGHVYLV